MDMDMHMGSNLSWIFFKPTLSNHLDYWEHGFSFTLSTTNHEHVLAYFLTFTYEALICLMTFCNRCSVRACTGLIYRKLGIRSDSIWFDPTKRWTHTNIIKTLVFEKYKLMSYRHEQREETHTHDTTENYIIAIRFQNYSNAYIKKSKKTNTCNFLDLLFVRENYLILSLMNQGSNLGPLHWPWPWPNSLKFHPLPFLSLLLPLRSFAVRVYVRLSSLQGAFGTLVCFLFQFVSLPSPVNFSVAMLGYAKMLRAICGQLGSRAKVENCYGHLSIRVNNHRQHGGSKNPYMESFII
jgi:hypothetical protein